MARNNVHNYSVVICDFLIYAIDRIFFRLDLTQTNYFQGKVLSVIEIKSVIVRNKLFNVYFKNNTFRYFNLKTS